MKIVIILVLGLLSQTVTFSQGLVNFDINFEAGTPHGAGVPDSLATLSDGVFSAAIYLDDTVPTSCAIFQKVGTAGLEMQILQFPASVLATYPGGGPAYDFEGSWNLTASQINSLMAGQWDVHVTYDPFFYEGQIAAVPEPSSIRLFAAVFIVFILGLYFRVMPPNFFRYPICS
ncbi:MAG TPA: hypothetical protein VGH42_04660 [Verrucomicrobiae bacterium]|jgi:hypothetical protein